MGLWWPPAATYMRPGAPPQSRKRRSFTSVQTFTIVYTHRGLEDQKKQIRIKKTKNKGSKKTNKDQKENKKCSCSRSSSSSRSSSNGT